MESIEICKKRILFLILRNGASNYISEEIIRRYFGSHWSDNHNKAIDELLYTDKFLLMVIAEGVKHYCIDPDKLEKARSLVTQQFVLKPQTNEIVQQYDASEPRGYTFWKEEVDMDRQRKKSRYRIYYKQTDRENFVGQILSQSMYKPRNFYMGSLNDPRSRISRIWRAIQQAVTRNPHATFNLQNIQDIDRKAVNNNRQAGKIGLLIFEELGWIRVVKRVGVSKIYAVALHNAKFQPTIDDFITEPLEEIFNDLEDLSYIEPEPDSYPESKEEDKGSHD